MVSVHFSGHLRAVLIMVCPLLWTVVPRGHRRRLSLLTRSAALGGRKGGEEIGQDGGYRLGEVYVFGVGGA